MPNQERIWLIWSNEHRAWWGPESMGYVGIIERAGRYSFKSASEICDDANRCLPQGKTHEVMVLSPEAAGALLEVLLQNKRLRERVESLEGRADA